MGEVRAHLTRGVTSGTLLRDEALYFNRIGTFIERADNTTRLLESRWRDPGGRGERLLARGFGVGRTAAGDVGVRDIPAAVPR